MKRLVLLLAATLWAGCAYAQSLSFPGPGSPASSGGGGGGMVFPLLSYGSIQATVNNTAATYAPLMGSATNAASWTTSATGDLVGGSMISIPGTISKLTARVPGTITTGKWTLALFKNSTAAAALTCDIDSAGTPNGCSDAVNSVSVAAGDHVGWKLVPNPLTTTTALPLIQIGAVFTATNANEAQLWTGPGNVSTTVAQYNGLGAAMASGVTLANIATVMPTSGTIDLLYAEPYASPGANGYWLTIYKNGSPTALQCRVTTAVKCSEPTQQVTVVAGDLVGIEACPGMAAAPSVGSGGCTPGTAGTPTGTGFHSSVRWVPTIAGEYPVMASSPSGSPSNVATTYLAASGGSSNNVTTEASVYNIAPIAFTVSKLYFSVLTAPGGTTPSRTATLRGGAAGATSTALTTTITGGAVSNSDTTHTVSVANGDLLDWLSGVATSPATTLGWRASVVVTVP